jgi:hypothetical protein
VDTRQRAYPEAKDFCRCGHPDYYHDAYQFLLFFIRRGPCTWWSAISSDRDCKCKGYRKAVLPAEARA